MTEQDRERYVRKQKQNQQLFTIDQLRDRLTEEGMTEPEIKRITKLRSFEGFSRLSLYSTLIVLLGLMGAVVSFRFFTIITKKARLYSPALTMNNFSVLVPVPPPTNVERAVLNSNTGSNRSSLTS